MKRCPVSNDPGHAVRKARIAIPVRLQDTEFFLCHSFFVVERRTGLLVEHTPITTDEIVCDATFTYYELTGVYTHMCIKWTLDGWRSFTYSPMEVDGIESSSEVGAHRLYDAIHGVGSPDYFAKRVMSLRALPWPHVFRGRVFAPSGARMDYCFHMVQKTPTAYTEAWDNNKGLNFSKVLRPTAWEKFPGDAPLKHSVNCNMRRTRLRSAVGQMERDIWVYLPPTYQTDPQRRFPVLYMNDGQNLFDNAAAFAGVAWGVGEIMEKLSSEGLDLIVVGVENGRLARTEEFTSFIHEFESVGQSRSPYIDFIVHTVDPEIRRAFRTQPGRAFTGIMGSSFGGLISLAGYFAYPEVFGFCASLSNWMWRDDVLNGEKICGWLRQMPTIQGYIYLDYGRDEEVLESLRGHLAAEQRLAQTRELVNVLRMHGYRDRKNLFYREIDGVLHCEAEWGHRLPDVLRWLGQRSGLYAPTLRTSRKPN
jgi:predicted alpha/beta superfamily hydrolase